MIPFVLFFLAFGIIFYVISLLFENWIMAFFSSIFLMLVGVYSMINGFTIGDATWFTRMISTVILGLGFFIMTSSSLNLLKQMEEGDNEE